MTHSEGDPIIQELRAMKQRMDVLFDESLNEERPHPEAPSFEDRTWHPPMDVWETDGTWVVTVDLPGVRDEDLVLQVGHGVLIISGTRTLPSYPSHAAVHASERQFGSFERSFELPKDARHDHIEAELKGGVLTVKVQRREGDSRIARKIPVQSE